MPNPLISIVTMVHIRTEQDRQYLIECCESVQNQIFRDFEHLIVDAGSPLSLFGWSKWREALRVLKIENLGMSTSRNAGIAEARGQYVICLDGDDMLAPAYLAECLKEMNERTIVSPGIRKFGAEQGDWCPTEPCTYSNLAESNRIICAAMFPRRKWAEVGGYDAALDWLSCEDWEFWLSLMRAGCQMRYVPRPLFLYRIHEGSRTARCRDKERIAENYVRMKHGRSQYAGT